MKLYSYVVRYDSGFAPNPFFGFCTLATCKPDIRKVAEIGEFVVGTASACKKVGRGGFLVYAMRVTEVLSFEEYWQDLRFQRKKPNLFGSRKHTCGDNIYYRDPDTNDWGQLTSLHSERDGTPSRRHLQRDTGVNRILVSEDFVYFGGCGPKLPGTFRNFAGLDLCKAGRGRKLIEQSEMIEEFDSWLRSAYGRGYLGPPSDWL